MDDNPNTIAERVGRSVVAETWTGPLELLPPSDAIDPDVRDTLVEPGGDGGPATTDWTLTFSDAGCSSRLDSGCCTVRSGSEPSLQRCPLWN